jgi:hypothetical protein
MSNLSHASLATSRTTLPARRRSDAKRPAPYALRRLSRAACSCGGTCPGCKGGAPLQAKLAISQPGDPYEREADQVADQVMRMAAPSELADTASSRQPQISRMRRTGTALPSVLQREEVIEDPLPEDEPEVLSAKSEGGSSPAVSPAAEARLGAMSGGGQPLPESARTFFEPRFGYDFSDVRVHTGGQATEAAASINALAFTMGRHVVFGAGQYAPDSPSGKRLLAHELTHVVQQEGAETSVMRTPACNCAAIGARDPTPAETADAAAKYPNLVSGDWCVTGAATAAYNCIAWTIGVTNRWVWDEVDAAGDGDGTVSVADFDAFYALYGLRPVENATPANPQVALFGNSSGPTHGALVSEKTCGGGTMFESKRGQNIRILHWVQQLEGGIYGNIIKYYI